MLHKKPSLSVVGVTALAVLMLSACGGGGSSSTNIESSGNSTPVPSSNVALSSKGASITSSYSGNESFVVDGDISATNYWEAGANDDWLTIDFGQSYSVETVTVYHANMSSNGYFSIAFSADGETYTTINNVSDCGVRLQLGASEYSCTLSAAIDARYLHFTVLDNYANIDIHEIQVMGK